MTDSNSTILQKRANRQRWVERHPEANRECKLKYTRTESGSQKRREWKERNRESINARNRELFRLNPEPFMARIRRRKEREAAAEGVFTIADEQSMFTAQNGRCKHCLRDILDGNYHADHIIALVNGGSHWPSNRQLLCPACNHRKGTK